MTSFVCQFAESGNLNIRAGAQVSDLAAEDGEVIAYETYEEIANATGAPMIR